MEELRKESNSQGVALIIYRMIMNVVCVITVIAITVFAYIGTDMQQYQGTEDPVLAMIDDITKKIVAGSGWGYILSVFIGMLIMLVWKKREFFRDRILQKGQKMNAKGFFSILAFFFSCQFLVQIAVIGVEMLLKPLGMNLDAMVEMSSANTSSLSMILYVGIVAPITEELLFRGLILRSFEPHGKGIAVYTSAILFGLFHGNPIQIPFAILTGIILAYTTLEYGIGWAILLHIINNLGLGIIIPEALEFMPNNGADIVVYGIITAAFIAALILAVVRRERLKEVRMQWKTEPWQRKAVAGSAGIIIISIMCLFDAALMILALMIL